MLTLLVDPQALKFAGSQQYHAINNNCIHTTDFLCRVLTGKRQLSLALASHTK